MRPFRISLLIVAAALALSSCRTSQQARRSQQSARNAPVAATREMDSLVLIADRMVNVIDSLTSLVDEDRSRIRTLEQEVAQLRARIEGRMPLAPARVSRPLPAPGGQSTGYTAPASAPETPAPASPAASTYETRYTDALHAYNSGQYNSALTMFRALAQEDTGSPYAANYLYWQGESLFALHKYNQALQLFSQISDRYPNSLKADDAQFKIGESYERMNLPASARDAYRALIDRSPNSEYVSRAESRLKKLK